MIPDDLCYLGLIDVGRQIQTRQLSSVEVTRKLLERVAKLDGRLRSYATVTPEIALQAAEEADREIGHGVHRGPLHGVPIAVKDLFHTRGIATTAGMAIYRNFVPERDATVVSRLKAAGAVLVGKLQMTEGAFSAHHPSSSRRSIPGARRTGPVFPRAAPVWPRRRDSATVHSGPTHSARSAFRRR